MSFPVSLKVLKIDVGCKPEVVEIKGLLEDMQEICGGYVEAIHIDEGYYLYVNEDGRAMELPLNRFVNNQPILGNIFIGKVNRATGDMETLDQDAIDLFTTIFSAKNVFLG